MTWSLSQVIDKKERVSLVKDLLALSWMLEDKYQDTTNGMINTILRITTLTGITTDTLENILINHVNE